VRGGRRRNTGFMYGLRRAHDELINIFSNYPKEPIPAVVHQH
jgi:hypothetical protein